MKNNIYSLSWSGIGTWHPHLKGSAETSMHCLWYFWPQVKQVILSPKSPWHNPYILAPHFSNNFCPLPTRKLYTKGKNDVLVLSFIFILSSNKLGIMDLLFSFGWNCSFSPLVQYIVIVCFASVAIAFKCSPPTTLSTIEHISIVVIL